jgi:hypothetical protein
MPPVTQKTSFLIHPSIEEREDLMSTATDTKAKTDTKVKDALDHVRSAMQELHGAIHEDAAKREGATKADLEAFAQKAKAATKTLKDSIGSQNQAVKKQLTDAASHLDATQKHIGEALKSSGEKFQTSVRKAAADTRASLQKVSEAIAAKRSAASTKKAS